MTKKKKIKIRKRNCLRRSEYRNYIQSDRWAAKKREYWASKLIQHCYVCERSDLTLDLHHKTYKRLGYEKLQDLIPLCREHHEETHKLHRENIERRKKFIEENEQKGVKLKRHVYHKISIYGQAKQVRLKYLKRIKRQQKLDKQS